MTIVRLANFVTPVSGGLRTALRHLGAGYLAAGHRPVLVVPGPVRRTRVDRDTEQGTVITLPGRTVPGTGGYRVLLDRQAVADLLAELRPDRLEVSDRSTLRWTGDWARRHGVPAAMVSHESLDGLLRTWGLSERLAGRAADRLNAATARDHQAVICTTQWAAEEFARIGARNIVRAPLGVDLEQRHPRHRDPAARARYAAPDEVLLVLCSRLSPEKRPERALDALAELRARGVPAVLAVAGDGPLRARLAARAGRAGLPVRWLGHLTGADTLSALLAGADVALAPGPIETFGLAALEALACGTPVAVSRSSALPGIIGGAGVAAADTGPGFADAVQLLLARPEPERRRAARVRAERYGWDRATAAFLAAHRAANPVSVPRADLAPLGARP
ncbi:glycosyltransferase [Streptacidiphilus sp. P02-A3a]|uniref:glycosyltransferase n=1 Tax=Streptacidiphilus sp. P02-A3a TaxID=2704468 RepID=UPI0015FC80C4|nr:glycosyltransferase [Streptacidiphilus sp. P02-A3a]QMU73991.1 glycosyltransferase family 1 protein [Streptacidiphilus sp. P02-A3a]